MSNVESWKTWEGRSVDGIPLRQWLGGSAHSAVFLTEKSGSQKAVKLIAADAAADRQLSRWRAAAKLSHPHLIRIFESGRGQIDNVAVLYVVMELADEDLAQILPQRPLAPSEATDLLPPLLDALSYLHQNGFVHGRIQPSNVLAVGDQLKLSADQITSAAETDPERRRRDIYDAPETAAGIVSPAGDLWSVGVTLVAALTQNVSFVGEAEHGGPKLPATIPEPFRGIARECLHLDPKRRCSIAEIKARLQPAARSVPLPAAVSPQPSRSSAHYGYTWRIVIPIAVLAVFVLGWRLFHKAIPPAASAQPETGATAVPDSPKPAKPTPAPAVPPATAPKPAPAKSTSSSGEVVNKVLPDVPRSARNTITGTIKVGVRVEVNSEGKVTDAKLTSPSSSQYFNRLALQAAQRWQFAPAASDQSAASAWLLHFRFRRSSTEATPERARN